MGIVSKFGVVISTKMQKTIRVRVANTKIHPIVQKPVTFHKNFFAHDEKEEAVLGDLVRIDTGRKYSKMKTFVLVEIVKPASRYVEDDGTLHTQKQHASDINKSEPI
jgi:small subunit ribosomal protein S17